MVFTADHTSWTGNFWSTNPSARNQLIFESQFAKWRVGWPGSISHLGANFKRHIQTRPEIISESEACSHANTRKSHEGLWHRKRSLKPLSIESLVLQEAGAHTILLRDGRVSDFQSSFLVDKDILVGVFSRAGGCIWVFGKFLHVWDPLGSDKLENNSCLHRTAAAEPVWCFTHVFKFNRSKNKTFGLGLVHLVAHVVQGTKNELQNWATPDQKRTTCQRFRVTRNHEGVDDHPLFSKQTELFPKHDLEKKYKYACKTETKKGQSTTCWTWTSQKSSFLFTSSPLSPGPACFATGLENLQKSEQTVLNVHCRIHFGDSSDRRVFLTEHASRDEHPTDRSFWIFGIVAEVLHYSTCLSVSIANDNFDQSSVRNVFHQIMQQLCGCSFVLGVKRCHAVSIEVLPQASITTHHSFIIEGDLDDFTFLEMYSQKLFSFEWVKVGIVFLKFLLQTRVTVLHGADTFVTATKHLVKVFLQRYHQNHDVHWWIRVLVSLFLIQWHHG